MSLFNLGAPSWLWEAINSLWLMLCKWIYIGINWFYQVFEKVASVNLFSTEVFKEITSRIYVVMGIAMLFIFAYNLVLMIINPEDKKGSGAMGKVIKETMISLVVVVVLPTIFNYMYIVQSHILESNIIGQIIMGSVGSTTGDRTNCDSDDYDCLCDFSKFEEFEQYNNTNIGWFWSSDYQTQGKTAVIKAECENYRGYNGSKITDSQRGAYSIAPTVFSAFYRPTNFTMEQCENYLVNNDTSVLKNDKDQKICVNYYFDVNMSKYTGNITPFVDDSYLNGIISDSSDKSMEFNWPFALIAGGLAVWMFICYAMEIGVRVAKLGLLQILSPIAVMMRVIPGQKEKMFDKWFTHLKNTYLDVFIRLVIIYFSLFAISLVPDVINTLWISAVTQEAASSSTLSGFFIKTLAMVVVILGILKFAQEAPALIKEFFGDSGRFALKSPKKQLQDNKLAMGGLGAIGGGIASMFANGAQAKGFDKITSATSGLFGGARRGFKYGSESKDFAALKKGIKTTQAESDAIRRKHEAIRRDEGKIFGKEIPIASGIWGQAVHSWKDVKSGAIDFKDFLFGNVPSSELGSAANNIMMDVDNMESDFSNANIANIKEGRAETMKKFNADQDFDFNGKHYHKVDSTHWSDGTRNNINHDDLGKDIVESYKNRLAKAYANNEIKDGIIDGFKRANESMLKDLRDSMPKFGEEFSNNLFKKLNSLKDANGVDMNLNVQSLDDLEARMKNLMQSEAGLASIYKINDEIKSLAKGIKISNDQALKAMDSKDKKDK